MRLPVDVVTPAVSAATLLAAAAAPAAWYSPALDIPDPDAEAGAFGASAATLGTSFVVGTPFTYTSGLHHGAAYVPPAGSENRTDKLTARVH